MLNASEIDDADGLSGGVKLEFDPNEDAATWSVVADFILLDVVETDKLFARDGHTSDWTVTSSPAPLDLSCLLSHFYIGMMSLLAMSGPIFHGRGIFVSNYLSF